MQLGIFAKTFAGNDPQTVMQAAKHAGFDAVHYNLSCSGLPSMPEQVHDATLDAIRAASHATGVAIAGLSGTYNMAHPDARVRADGARRLRVVIAAAATIGATIVTLCTGSRDPEDQWRAHPDNASQTAWDDMMVVMRDAVAAAEQAGVDLGIEPELANVVSDAARAQRLIDEIDSPRVRIVIDPANLFETAPDAERRSVIDGAVAALGPHIAMAHAKDRDITGGFVAAGTGVVDFATFIAQLRAADFDGPLIAHGCTAGEAPGVAQRLAPLVART